MAPSPIFVISHPSPCGFLSIGAQRQGRMVASMGFPAKGGFSFDLCARNVMLEKTGQKIPVFRKTRTAIVGLFFSLPDFPCSNHNRFHEERDILLLPCMRKSRENAEIIIPLNANSVPAPFGKGAIEEEVRSSSIPAVHRMQ